MSLEFLNACRNGDEKTMIEYISQNNFNEGYALEYACEYNRLSIVNLLIKKIDDEYINWGLFGACTGGNLDIVKLMISHGANKFKIALCCACKGRNKEIISLLVSHGANNFEFGLMSACNAGNIAMVYEMIDRGASIRTLDTLDDFWKFNRKILFGFINISLCDDIKSIIYSYLKLE